MAIFPSTGGPGAGIGKNPGGESRREGSEPDGHAEERAFLGVIEGAELVGFDVDIEEAVSAVQADKTGEADLDLGPAVGEVEFFPAEGGGEERQVGVDPDPGGGPDAHVKTGGGEGHGR